MYTFQPNLTPREVIQSGAFGGSYFGIQIQDKTDYNYKELFDYHFKGLDPELYLSKKYKPRNNLYKIRSGKSYQYWKQKGWIGQRDPYGWFEWWCKYEMGYRDQKEDYRQISRWQDFCGFKGRWRNRIYNRINQTDDWTVSPRIQQSLLHWGYKVNEQDYQMWIQHKRYL